MKELKGYIGILDFLPGLTYLLSPVLEKKERKKTRGLDFSLFLPFFSIMIIDGMRIMHNRHECMLKDWGMKIMSENLTKNAHIPESWNFLNVYSKSSKSNSSFLLFV